MNLHKIKRTLTLAAMVAAWLMPSSTPAQQSSGSITGTVTDPSGAVIPGAVVSAAREGGSANTVQTGTDGRYTLESLTPGIYTLRVTAPDFAPFEKKNLNVMRGSRLTLDVRLDLEVATQEITVTETATVDVDPSRNAGAIVLKGEDLEAFSDNPEDFKAELQALAGPAAGPNGGQIFIDGFSGGQLPPKSSIREIRINQNPFSAEFDKPGFGRIEILTKPGTDKFHGQAFFNFGDSALNSRNPFAPNKPSYQSRMLNFNLGGPLTKKSSFFFDVERHNMDETSVVNAFWLDPSFHIVPVSEAVLNPRTRTSFSPRIDYQLSPNHTLTARYSFSRMVRENEGIGGLSLASRRYDSTSSNHTLQVVETAVLGPSVINETRFQYTRGRNAQTALSSDPTLSVLGAFTGGGAGVGFSYVNEGGLELYNSTSVARGSHLLRFGGRFRRGTESSYSMQDYNGTFTFATLDAYRITLAGLQNGLSPEQIRALGGGPSQFSITGGNPLAKINQMDLGLFVQDDWRLRQNFSLNLGLRYETQSNISDHLDFAPRIGFAWGIGGNGKQPDTVVRGGFGIFYDRVGEDLVLQAIRLNGVNQLKFLVPFPDFFPNVPPVQSLAANRLPAAIRELDAGLRAPYIAQTVLSVERKLPKNVSVSLAYANSRGLRTLRSRNINAPLPGTYDPANPRGGVRPHGELGDIYVFESSGMFKQSQLITNVSARVNSKFNLFGFYVLGKAESNTDGAADFPANQYDLSSEWGRAGYDVRHRMMIGGSIAAPLGFRLSPFITASSGRPFDITVGKDLNGDSLFNDRPAFATDLSRPSVVTTAWGVFDRSPLPDEPTIPRNYGEGPGQFTVNLRLSKTFGFGGERSSAGPTQESGAMGPPPGGPRGGGMRMGGGPGGPRGMFGEAPSGTRYSLTFSAAAHNLLNHVNLATPIGNLNSPLFGISNALAGGFGPQGSTSANRRIDFQVRFSF